MQPRISEVRQMVKILDREHDDVEALAKAVIAASYDMYEARDTFVVLLRDSVLKDLFVFGFYDTKNRAEKAINTLPAPTPGADRWGTRKVIKNIE